MTPRTRLAAALAVVIGAGVSSPGPAFAQSPGPGLSGEELEAHSMGLEMAFACSPRRHGEAIGSSSTIRREADALAGTAVHFRSIEGTFIALEEYDDALDGHCLVLGWWGGELAPGMYPIARLAMSAMEQEQTTGEHSFYAWGAVRTTGENIMILVESGSLDIGSIDGGNAAGTFELSGVVVEGNARGPTFRWAGSFSATAAEPL